MAQTPEGRVKSSIKSWLNSQGFYHFSPIGGPFATHGIPDLVVCAHGRFIGIECKAPGKAKNTTANQDHQLKAIQDSGGLAFVATSLDDVVASFARCGILKV